METNPLPLHRHPQPHIELIRRHKEHWRQKYLAAWTLLCLIGFFVSIFVIQPYAVNFSTERASNSVTDIVLSNIPVFDVGWLFVNGMFVFIAFITLLCFAHPKRAPFTLNCLSLFIIIRSIFVSLTHLGPFATHATSNFGPAITKAFFGADFFFSGHTGAPFLLALMYWHEPRLRYVFLLWSIFFAVIVLAGHLHYSIDVLSAFFITYTIYHLALWLFPTDRALFLSKS